MAQRIALVLSAAALGLSTTLAPAARAEEGRPVVPVPEAPRRDPLLVTSGAVLFGVPYAVSAYGAAVSEYPRDRLLFIPVAGPFANIVARSVCSGKGCGGNSTVAFGLTLDGLLQGGGAYILLRSLLSPGTPEPSQAHVHVAPTSFPGGGGIAAFGAF
jgi:hypothetical protein